MKRTLLSVSMIFFLLSSSAFARSGKEFTTSVIYGTLAGTLVGAATLAFTSDPGDNLNNVARGASYGLYAGILLGLYVTYAVGDGPPPSTETIQPDQNIYEGNPPSANPPPPEENKPQSKNHSWTPTFALYPVLPTNPSHPKDWGVGATLLNIRF